MNEFDKCNFCSSVVDGECTDTYNCREHAHFRLDVNRVFNKADELGISVSDLLRLIKECNK